MLLLSLSHAMQNTANQKTERHRTSVVSYADGLMYSTVIFWCSPQFSIAWLGVIHFLEIAEQQQRKLVHFAWLPSFMQIYFIFSFAYFFVLSIEF